MHPPAYVGYCNRVAEAPAGRLARVCVPLWPRDSCATAEGVTAGRQGFGARGSRWKSRRAEC